MCFLLGNCRQNTQVLCGLARWESQGKRSWGLARSSKKFAYTFAFLNQQFSCLIFYVSSVVLRIRMIRAGRQSQFQFVGYFRSNIFKSNRRSRYTLEANAVQGEARQFAYLKQVGKRKQKFGTKEMNGSTKISDQNEVMWKHRAINSWLCVHQQLHFKLNLVCVRAAPNFDVLFKCTYCNTSISHWTRESVLGSPWTQRRRNLSRCSQSQLLASRTFMGYGEKETKIFRLTHNAK